jgi:hypothetical protein
MDLQEILNHRSNCIICSHKMELEVISNANLNIDVHDSGLKISSGHSGGILMRFGFDGKYQRNRRHYNIYKHPVRITKYCKQCNESSYQPPPEVSLPKNVLTPSLVKNIILKGRSVGATTMSAATNRFTTLNNMKSKECSYAFMIMGDGEGNYDGGLLWEDVRYHDDNAFWHLNTSYVSKVSTLTHSTFDATMNDVMSLQIPAPINLNNIENIDQFLSKYKMYVMMS